MNRRARSPIRMVLVCCLLLAGILAGCSTVRLAYNNSDWLVLKYADDYLDLTPEQRGQLRAALRQALDEHRREELGRIVAYLRTLRAYAADGLTGPEVDQLLASLTPLYEGTAGRIMPVFAPVMTALSDAQIAHLSRQLDEYNHEYREDYLEVDRSERLDRRAERVATGVERWTGELSRVQRQMVRGISRSWPDLAQDWYDYDVAMQQGLLALLRTRADGAEVQAYLTDWWILQTRQSRELAHKTDRLMTGAGMLVLALDATLSHRQRRHFLDRVQTLADELEPLIPAREATVAAATR